MNDHLKTVVLPADNDQSLAPEFFLTRLILIDSYAKGKTVEIDVTGHTALTGENASGKTTLLRLFPLFFGEAPSRVIQSDENNLKFGRHYLPHTSSYVVFEYSRRGQRVLAVIHGDGQSDGVSYRFINRPYGPELFRDMSGLVQSQDLSRHLTRLNVEFTKALSLTQYRQILQNEAGRELRQQSALYSFTGSGGRLKHIERVVTAILQRATTFFDLKRMIVSSIQESTDTFSMRTSKRELSHWINEYEAHSAIMDLAPMMNELELADEQRRLMVQEFSVLNARFQVMHDHYEQQVIAAEAEEERLVKVRTQKIADYNQRSTSILDAVNRQRSEVKGIEAVIAHLDERKKAFDRDKADERVRDVDALPDLESRLSTQRQRLKELEDSSKGIVEVFDTMEKAARQDAEADRRREEDCKSALTQNHAEQQSQVYARHTQIAATITEKHRTELVTLNAAVAECSAQKARAESEVHNAQPSPEAQQAYDLALEQSQEAARRTDAIRNEMAPMEKALLRAQQRYVDAETDFNASQQALERAEGDLQDLIDAGNAGEETLLGFLRLNKPNWALDIGRLVSEETLMRRDLTPSLTGGEDLFGVSIDLDKLEATRLGSEESIQQEIKRLGQVVQKRKTQLDEDTRKRTEAARHRQTAKEQLDAKEIALTQSIHAKAAADQQFLTAKQRLLSSKEAARRAASVALDSSKTAFDAAMASLSDAQRRHADEITSQTKANADELADLTQKYREDLQAIATRIKQLADALMARLAEITRQRNHALKDNGVDLSVLEPIQQDVSKLAQAIEDANKYRACVTEYRDWLDLSWSGRAEQVEKLATARHELKRLEESHRDLLRERDLDLAAHDRTAQTVADQMDKAAKQRREASAQIGHLASWPKDASTLERGFDDSVALELLANRRRDLSREYLDLQKRIREGVDDIRKKMMSVPGSRPEQYHVNAQKRVGYPGPGQEHLWIEELRGWFQHEHLVNRESLIQLGKTLGLNISDFWKGLGNFKKQIGNFASDLKAHLHQGQVFANISDVSVIITTDVEKQGYWQAIEALHFELDTWHALGDALPPASFVQAAREVALVLSDEKGLVADPVDLINLQVTANIDGDGSKVAKNESALARMSSNGLSYIILVVILIGFINRIRRKERITIPFVVDELKDLSVVNATALLNLLERNNVTMVSAFPDVDPDLAPLFNRNYKILPGRTLATVQIEDEESVHA